MKIALLALSVSVSLLADIRVKSTLTAAGSTTESTVYTKGARQRLEYGTDATLIQQCDRKRLLQLDAVTSTFQTIDTTPAAIPQTPQPGGPVTIRTALTDTAETKLLFGYKARHIKSVVTRAPSPQACDKTATTVETDGWYIDLPAAWADAKAKKPGVLRVAVAPVNDRTGPGGPVYTQRIFKDLGQAKIETVQLNAGTEVDQLAKAKAVEADFLLTATVTEMKQPAPPAKPANGLKRFGGMVSKTAGLVNERQAWEARIEYRLLSPKDGATLLASTASGKNGGNTFNVRGAISLATTVGTMVMFGPMGPNMLRGNLGGMLSGMNGQGGMFAPGMMGQGPMGGMGGIGGMNPMTGPRTGVDPSLMGLQMLSFTQSANAAPSLTTNPTGESDQAKAVEVAIADMVKTVIAHPRQ